MVGLGHCGHSQACIRMLPMDSRLNLGGNALWET